ncbi:hypothetical protein HPB47_000913 [Ixodes persulcatus]|uniref:Uncharacterized protein n=1 Tax=Ixodes persulcatus TaxID=34615 RepID=A0AC60PQL8_IXOPE|nr:hypothetical protein HPB47_000913 [Ixodes persulcatus]
MGEEWGEEAREKEGEDSPGGEREERDCVSGFAGFFGQNGPDHGRTDGRSPERALEKRGRETVPGLAVPTPSKSSLRKDNDTVARRFRRGGAESEPQSAAYDDPASEVASFEPQDSNAHRAWGQPERLAWDRKQAPVHRPERGPYQKFRRTVQLRETKELRKSDDLAPCEERARRFTLNRWQTRRANGLQRTAPNSGVVGAQKRDTLCPI